MLLYNASKKIELLLNASIQKIVSPKSPKDTILVEPFLRSRYFSAVSSCGRTFSSSSGVLVNVIAQTCLPRDASGSQSGLGAPFHPLQLLQTFFACSPKRHLLLKELASSKMPFKSFIAILIGKSGVRSLAKTFFG